MKRFREKKREVFSQDEKTIHWHFKEGALGPTTWGAVNGKYENSVEVCVSLGKVQKGPREPLTSPPGT